MVPIEEYPLVDTTNLDSLVATYSQIQQTVNPIELLDVTSNGLSVDDELIGTIREEAMKFSGMVLYASAQFAVSIDTPDQINPSMSTTDGSCTFAGKIADVSIIDFTDAIHKAGLAADRTEKIFLPGIVFETDSRYEDVVPSLGIISLQPYCALLPSSAYELRRLRFAA